EGPPPRAPAPPGRAPAGGHSIVASACGGTSRVLKGSGNDRTIANLSRRKRTTAGRGLYSARRPISGCVGQLFLATAARGVSPTCARARRPYRSGVYQSKALLSSISLHA